MKTKTKSKRAEKIAKVLASLLNYEPRLADSNYAAFIEELTSQISEAVREAIEEDRKIWDAQHALDLKLHSELAFTTARDKAAVLADTLAKELDEESTDKVFGKKFKEAIKKMNGSIVAEECAERIRAMEP